MNPLYELVRSHEDWLMRRILQYAIERDYAQYTSTLLEPWRLSIRGLSEPLLEILAAGSEDLELHPDADFTRDPVAAFGILEAQRHRVRGIPISMFIGLLKYYRETYLDLLREEANFSPADLARYQRLIHRFFDRMELGLVAEWTEGTDAERIRELQATNRVMTNEKNKYLTLFESLADPVVLLDQELRVENLNQAAAVLLNREGNRFYRLGEGIPQSELDAYVGMDASTCMPWLKPLLDQFHQARSRVHGGDIALEQAGKTRIFHAKLSPMLDVSDKYTGALIYLDDQTDRREAEARMRLAKESAEQANRAKSDFLASMSHELRTPLNAVLGFSRLLEEEPALSADVHDQLRVITRGGEHLLTLINQILDFAKVDSGRMTLRPRDFDLPRMVAEMVDVFQLRAARQNLVLRFEPDPEILRHAHGDETKLRQIWINLLGNALKFTESGGVEVRARTAAEDDHWILHGEVADTGPGIAETELETLFEPFTQTETGRAAQEGTGLGLAISRRFARMMGGDLKIHSQLGVGSVFSFQVRLETGQAPSLIPEEIREARALAPGQPDFRLLVVDDKEDNRWLLLKILTPMGFAVREARDGREALAIWEDWHPDLVWMDMRMPGMDGFETTRRIKADPRGAATTVIAVTASVFEEDREKVMATGCDAYLRKPFHRREVCRLLEQHLGARFIEDHPPPPLPAVKLHEESRQGLAAEWLAAFRESAECLDLEQAEILVKDLPPERERLARALRSALADYRFDHIQTWLGIA